MDKEIEDLVDWVLENLNWEEMMEDIRRKIWEEGFTAEEAESFSDDFSDTNC